MAILVADQSDSSIIGVIEVQEEGAYLLIYDRSNPTFCKVDQLQDDIEMAKEAGLLDFGIPREAWAPDADRPPVMRA